MAVDFEKLSSTLLGLLCVSTYLIQFTSLWGTFFRTEYNFYIGVFLYIASYKRKVYEADPLFVRLC